MRGSARVAQLIPGRTGVRDLFPGVSVPGLSQVLSSACPQTCRQPRQQILSPHGSCARLGAALATRTSRMDRPRHRAAQLYHSVLATAAQWVKLV